MSHTTCAKSYCPIPGALFYLRSPGGPRKLSEELLWLLVYESLSFPHSFSDLTPQYFPHTHQHFLLCSCARWQTHLWCNGIIHVRLITSVRACGREDSKMALALLVIHRPLSTLWECFCPLQQQFKSVGVFSLCIWLCVAAHQSNAAEYFMILSSCCFSAVVFNHLAPISSSAVLPTGILPSGAWKRTAQWTSPKVREGEESLWDFVLKRRSLWKITAIPRSRRLQHGYSCSTLQRWSEQHIK